jgi:sugar O-acyltransferase (sialic acid O-acetyltransferase NeuD family)
MKQVYLYGAGGHAKVIIDMLKSNQITVSEIFDDNAGITSFKGIPVSHMDIHSPLILSIGCNAVRKKIVNQCENIVFHPAVIDSSAIVAESVQIEEGTVLMQGTIIQSSAKIGKHCIINTRASVDHDCVIEDYVHIAPGATLCGNVQVGEGTLIGAGTTIMPGVKIGKWSVIGAGSVVVRDIPDNVIAFGTPCKITKQHNYI